MKRKIITLLTALVVFACAAIPVSAAGFSESFCGTRLWCWIPSCVQPSCPSETPDTILGSPVRTSAYMPAIAASAKTIAFGDFSYYWIADRQGRSFKRLNELYAANGQVGFLASQRVDGKMILPEAVKVLVQKAS